MPLIPKPNYNQIFASQAPEQDKPAVFNNYPLGWGVESRPNNGKPTIKGFNFLQQTSDLKALWILQNGACLPYDESIEYAEGAPVLKDGVIQYKVGDGFKSRDSVTVPTYNNATDGVDPVSGVANGAYFNVRSSSDESYVDEYRNIGGSAVSTGKSFPSAEALSGVIADVDDFKESLTDQPSGALIPLINKEKLNRENVSVWDFFTPSEKTAYKASPTTFDAFRPLQEFFNALAVNNYGVAYCSGKFRTSQGIVFNVTGDGLNSTRTVIGELDVTCLNAIDTTFDFTLDQDFNWFGKVIARGQGGVSANSRTCQTGIRISTSSRAYFHKLVARTYIGHGVYLPDGDTLLKIGEVRTSDCGSGHYDTGSQLTNFTATSKTGSASSVAQRQVITVNDLPKFSRDDYYNVLIDGQPYFVSATNRTTKELTIFPWLPTTTTGGSLKYLYGAGIAVYGGDSSEVIIDSIDCVRTGTAYINGALYSANVTVLQTQSCGVAMQFGSSPASATIGGVIQNMYCEANAIDILRCTRSEANFFIASDVSLDLSKTRYMSAARDPSDNLITYNNLNGFSIFKNGILQSRSTIGNLELTNPQEPILYGNNFTSNLTINESALQAYPDVLVKKILYTGAGSNQQPTTGITLNPPVGYTLNGQSSLSFSDLSKTLEVTLGLRLGTKNIIVVSNHTPTSITTYDPPELTAAGTPGDVTTTTVALPGVVLGDVVQAAFSRYNAAIEISAQVSAANTVTVKFKNTSATPVDLASGTLTVKML